VGLRQIDESTNGVHETSKAWVNSIYLIIPNWGVYLIFVSTPNCGSEVLMTKRDEKPMHHLCRPSQHIKMPQETRAICPNFPLNLGSHINQIRIKDEN
jgi:hypothetical protein